MRRAPSSPSPTFGVPGPARGTNKAPIVGDHLLFNFQTTYANADVKPMHSKAMPVILASDEECERWLTAAADEA